MTITKHRLVYGGARYGHLTVAGPAFVVSRYSQGKMRREPYVVLDCDCGRSTAMPVHKLPKAKVCCGSSCRMKKPKARGPRFQPLYQVWNGMIQRCENQNRESYPGYGGRGIAICNEWRRDFWAFQNWAVAHGWRKDLAIDRIDNDGNYEPHNCRFVTGRVNSRNRRSNRFVFAFGETKTLIEWVEDDRCRVCLGTLWSRLNRGVPAEAAITSFASQGGNPITIREVVEHLDIGEA